MHKTMLKHFSLRFRLYGTNTWCHKVQWDQNGQERKTVSQNYQESAWKHCRLVVYCACLLKSHSCAGLRRKIANVFLRPSRVMHTHYVSSSATSTYICKSDDRSEKTDNITVLINESLHVCGLDIIVNCA